MNRSGRALPRYQVPVFLSYPKPFNSVQDAFIGRLRRYLASRDMVARTLGVTDYDMDAPLTAIRRLMNESHGLITVAFRRTRIERGEVNPSPDLTGIVSSSLSDVWATSPWAQIEPAMAFQLGLPILLLREHGVIEEGLLQRGVVGLYMPEIDLRSSASYFSSREWRDVISQWEQRVLRVKEHRGRPPELF